MIPPDRAARSACSRKVETGTILRGRVNAVKGITFEVGKGEIVTLPPPPGLRLTEAGQAAIASVPARSTAMRALLARQNAGQSLARGRHAALDASPVPDDATHTLASGLHFNSCLPSVPLALASSSSTRSFSRRVR